MSTTEATAVIRDAIRQAAAEVGCKPTSAHRPRNGDRQGLVARRIAVKSASRQGVPVAFLAAALDRERKTITELIRV